MTAACLSQDSSEERCYGRLYAKNARAQGDRQKSRGGERLDLRVDEPSFRSDGQGDRAANVPRCRGDSVGMGHQGSRFRSVRGSAVARWEFRPGSALYIAWNENRAAVAPLGDFRFRRDLRAIPGAPSHDVFLVKFSYWLPM